MVDGLGHDLESCGTDEVFSCFEAIEPDVGVLEQFRQVCDSDVRTEGRVSVSAADGALVERSVRVRDGRCPTPLGAVRSEKVDPVLGLVAEIRCP